MQVSTSIFYPRCRVTCHARFRMPQWATRCAVLASECLKTLNQYSEAALHLIRLISEDADLRSAVLLEQAALCFLRSATKSGQNGRSNIQL